jgi:hypothetical protein
VARFIGDRGGGPGANKAAAQRMTNPSTLATPPNPENHLDSAQVTKRSVNFDFEGSGEGFFWGGGPQPQRGTSTLEEFSCIYYNSQALNATKRASVVGERVHVAGGLQSGRAPPYGGVIPGGGGRSPDSIRLLLLIFFTWRSCSRPPPPAQRERGRGERALLGIRHRRV